MLRKGVAREVRLGEKAEASDPSGDGKLMPLRFADRPELHLPEDAVEQILQDSRVAQGLRRASEGFDNPLDSAHGRRWYYTWGFPHSGQNLALRGMALPHSLQNLVSAEGAPAAAGAEVDFFTASIMACPRATPAPRPAPTPTAPPPSFPAAIGMACATWYCVNLPMSPSTFMLMRWSSTFCNSSGSERFSTTKLSKVSPYSVKEGLRVSLIFSARAPWFAAISRNGTWLAAKASVILAIMVLRNWPSRSATR